MVSAALMLKAAMYTSNSSIRVQERESEGQGAALKSKGTDVMDRRRGECGEVSSGGGEATGER